jgi:hypothetical protein
LSHLTVSLTTILKELLVPYARRDIIAWLPGPYYHIYNRSVQRRTIFREPDNYLFVVSRLKKYAGDFCLTLIAYCLMPDQLSFVDPAG